MCVHAFCSAVSVENLFFLTAVEALQKQGAAPAPSPSTPPLGPSDAVAVTAPTTTTAAAAITIAASAAEQAREAAYGVYEKFVARGAAFEVNLSFEKAQPLHTEFGARLQYRKHMQQKVADSVAESVTGSSHTQQAAVVRGLGIGAARRRAAAHARLPRNNQAPSGSQPASPRVLPPPTLPPLPSATITAASGGSGRGGTKYAVAGDDPPALPLQEMKQSLPPTTTIISARLQPRAAAQLQLQDPFALPPQRNADYYLSIFDAAAREVRRLLETDSYPRFVAGKLFAQLVTTQLLSERLQAEAAAHVSTGSATSPLLGPSRASAPSSLPGLQMSTPPFSGKPTASPTLPRTVPPSPTPLKLV